MLTTKQIEEMPLVAVRRGDNIWLARLKVEPLHSNEPDGAQRITMTLSLDSKEDLPDFLGDIGVDFSDCRECGVLLGMVDDYTRLAYHFSIIDLNALPKRVQEALQDLWAGERGPYIEHDCPTCGVRCACEGGGEDGGPGCEHECAFARPPEDLDDDSNIPDEPYRPEDV